MSVHAVEKERALGQHYASEIRRQSKPLANSGPDAYAKRIGKTLVAQLIGTPFDYQFEVIAGGNWTEPFSLPGGYVFIPAQAFVVALDEAEFAGMLAHAISHAALRQGVRTAHMANVPLVFIGGWTGFHTDAQRAQTPMPASLLESHRIDELEADQFGLGLASRAGYAAAAYLRYVERTQPADSKTSPLPARELRLARLRETISALPPAMQSSSGEEFKLAQEDARSIVKQPGKPRTPTLRR